MIKEFKVVLRKLRDASVRTNKRNGVLDAFCTPQQFFDAFYDAQESNIERMLDNPDIDGYKLTIAKKNRNEPYSLDNIIIGPKQELDGSVEAVLYKPKGKSKSRNIKFTPLWKPFNPDRKDFVIYPAAEIASRIEHVTKDQVIAAVESESGILEWSPPPSHPAYTPNTYRAKLEYVD